MAKVLSFPLNSYQGYAVLVLRDPSRSTTKILVSREGRTQGCPLGMLAYAIAILPLIRQLKNPALHTQNWFVDDSACSGLLIKIWRWFARLPPGRPLLWLLCRATEEHTSGEGRAYEEGQGDVCRPRRRHPAGKSVPWRMHWQQERH